MLAARLMRCRGLDWRGMRIGFKTSQMNVGWPTMRATWELGDTLPAFDSAWIFDHFVALSDDGGGSHEAFALMGAVAVVTSRLQIGHLVLGNTYRHPALVANRAPRSTTWRTGGSCWA